jgi:uncharacterized protein
LKDKEAFDSISRDILESEIYQQNKKYIQHGTVSIYQHSLAVATMCYRLAGAATDVRALVRAALLHDLFLYDWHDWHRENWKKTPLWKLHGFIHPPIAAENARKYFHISDKEYAIITSHMWPLTLKAIPKSKEAWLLTLADKLVSIRETVFRHTKQKNERS